MHAMMNPSVVFFNSFYGLRWGQSVGGALEKVREPQN